LGDIKSACGWNSKIIIDGIHITIDLVGGLEHFFLFFHLYGNFIIPADELIFFRGVGQPATSILSYPTTLL